MITADGKISTTRIKFAGTITPEKIPKLLIGMIGLNTFAKKAAAVVLLVTDIALEERRKV